VTTVYLNRVATVVPPNDMHETFVNFARTLLEDRRTLALFDRMATKAQIRHRYSVLSPLAARDGLAVDRVYARGRFPSTGERMQLFERYAPALAAKAVDQLDLGDEARRVSHLIVSSCTGMYAPGIDLDLVERCHLDPSVERTMVGFMGCYAAINSLKLARHVVRSEPSSRVLVVNLELCSLHLQEATNLEQLLSFLVFGDGCAASLVTAEPTGLALDRFQAVLMPETRRLITWKIGDQGFDMFLSGRVPGAITHGLADAARSILNGAPPREIDRWAVHPGGRSVLDAVEQGLGLAPTALKASRDVLDRFGNMSSATIMFVLASVLEEAKAGQQGCAMAFGPGLTAETMLFHRV
jgi:predicted naringenin-chalcone synthase